jgi:hypothetical protein
MLGVTFLGLTFIPMLYVIVARVVERFTKRPAFPHSRPHPHSDVSGPTPAPGEGH